MLNDEMLSIFKSIERSRIYGQGLDNVEGAFAKVTTKEENDNEIVAEVVYGVERQNQVIASHTDTFTLNKNTYMVNFI